MCIVGRWKTEQPRESFLILLLFPMKIAGVIFIVVARDNPGPSFLSVSPDYICIIFKVLLIYGSERIMGNMALHNKWGGYFRNFSVGMCRWDPGTLNLYQS